MNLTDAIKEAYANAPDVTYYEVLIIENVNLSSSIFLVNSFAPITRIVPTTGVSGTFLPVRFEAQLPEISGGTRGEMVISVIGVPKEVRAEIRNATSNTEPFYVTWAQYIDDSATADAEFPVPLSIATIPETHMGIEIRALLPDLVGAYFPRMLMTTSALPGLKTI
jgi:hypothetical protein